jgi:DNA-directed RNA polymerase specialized sigma24 family protein
MRDLTVCRACGESPISPAISSLLPPDPPLRVSDIVRPEESDLQSAPTVYYDGMAEDSSDSPVGRGAVFRTTQWSVVINAGSDDSLVAAAALEQLCQRYWYPLYASVRRSGYSHADAADLTQSFFARLLEKKSLAGLAPSVARFRSFLLTALKHFLINEWQSAHRLKRGGGKQIVSLDEIADELYRAEPADDASPDKLFEKRWALSVIELGLARLRAEFVASERPRLFEALKPALTGDKLEGPYADIGQAFGLSESVSKWRCIGCANVLGSSSAPKSPRRSRKRATSKMKYAT